MEGNGAVSETPLNSIKNGFIDEKVGLVSFIPIIFVFFFFLARKDFGSLINQIPDLRLRCNFICCSNGYCLKLISWTFLLYIRALIVANISSLWILVIANFQLGF